MTAPLSGFGSTRRLGTASGDLRRAARQTNDPKARAALAVAAAQAKMNEPSAVTSAASNAAEQQYSAQSQAGLMEARRRATLGNGSVAAAPSMNAADAQKSRMEFYAKRNGTPTLAAARPPVAGGAAGNPAAPVPTTNADGLVSAPVTLSSPTAPQREGRIDGMPASLATARAPSSEPGNLGDLKSRDAANLNDRAGLIMRVRAESALPGSGSRSTILDRLNAERVAQGKAPIELTGKELADADRAERDLRASNAKGEAELASRTGALEENNLLTRTGRTPSGGYDLAGARAAGAAEGTLEAAKGEADLPVVTYSPAEQSERARRLEAEKVPDTKKRRQAALVKSNPPNLFEKFTPLGQATYRLSTRSR